MMRSTNISNNVLGNIDMNQMNNNKSKKRKNEDVGPTSYEQVLPDIKKVKQTNDNISKSNKENEEGIMYKKSEYSSLEKLLKQSEEVYDRALKGFEDKEKEQERALKELEEDFKQQKEGSDMFLKHMRKLTAVMEGDDKIESVVEQLEKECETLRTQARDQERVTMSLKSIEMENERLRKTLEKNKNVEDTYKVEIQKEIEKNIVELQTKDKKVRELQSILELYYSLTNLKINVESSQEVTSDFLCNIRSENGKQELEFRLKDNEDNEIEYDPIKCHVKPEILENYSFLQEELTFELSNMKGFFKNIFEVLNHQPKEKEKKK